MASLSTTPSKVHSVSDEAESPSSIAAVDQLEAQPLDESGTKDTDAVMTSLQQETLRSSTRVPALCCVCLDDTDSDTPGGGVTCGTGHTLCCECLDGYVRSTLGMSQAGARAREANNDAVPFDERPMAFKEFVAAGATLTCPGIMAPEAGADATAPVAGHLAGQPGAVCRLPFSLWALYPLEKGAFGELVAAREERAALEARRSERTRLVSAWPPLADALLAAELRDALPSAYECGRCHFGPIMHGACSDLRTHHLEDSQNRSTSVNNACPRCGWFVGSIGDWPTWAGVLPEGTAATMAPRATSASSASAASEASEAAMTARLAGYGRVKLSDRAKWALWRAWDRAKVGWSIVEEAAASWGHGTGLRSALHEALRRHSWASFRCDTIVALLVLGAAVCVPPTFFGRLALTVAWCAWALVVWSAAACAALFQALVGRSGGRSPTVGILFWRSGLETAGVGAWAAWAVSGAGRGAAWALRTLCLALANSSHGSESGGVGSTTTIQAVAEVVWKLPAWVGSASSVLLGRGVVWSHRSVYGSLLFGPDAACRWFGLPVAFLLGRLQAFILSDLISKIDFTLSIGLRQKSGWIGRIFCALLGDETGLLDRQNDRRQSRTRHNTRYGRYTYNDSVETWRLIPILTRLRMRPRSPNGIGPWVWQRGYWGPGLFGNYPDHSPSLCTLLLDLATSRVYLGDLFVGDATSYPIFALLLATRPSFLVGAVFLRALSAGARDTSEEAASEVAAVLMGITTLFRRARALLAPLVERALGRCCSFLSNIAKTKVT